MVKKILDYLGIGELQKNIVKRFHNAFLSIDLTKDLSLFDIKRMKSDYNREYFRLRKCKHRAIFYFENNNIYIVYTRKREEAYGLWKNFLVIDQITKTLDV